MYSHRLFRHVVWLKFISFLVHACCWCHLVKCCPEKCLWYRAFDQLKRKGLSYASLKVREYHSWANPISLYEFCSRLMRIETFNGPLNLVHSSHLPHSLRQHNLSRGPRTAAHLAARSFALPFCPQTCRYFIASPHGSVKFSHRAHSASRLFLLLAWPFNRFLHGWFSTNFSELSCQTTLDRASARSARCSLPRTMSHSIWLSQ